MRRSTLLLAIATTASADPKDPYASWRDPIDKVELFKPDGFDDWLEFDGWWK